jgi:hypothetical protein
MTDVKHCTKCGEEKPLQEFYKGSLAKGGTGKNSSWCKLCVTAYNRKDYQKHVEERKAYSRQYSRAHQEHIKQWRTEYYRKNKMFVGEQNYKWQHQQTMILRSRVIQRFGGKCERCGFDDYRALQIDHVLGDGAEERRNRNSGITFLNRLLNLSESELRGRYQLLCANCQWIKRRENNEHGGKYERELEFKISVS